MLEIFLEYIIKVKQELSNEQFSFNYLILFIQLELQGQDPTKIIILFPLDLEFQILLLGHKILRLKFSQLNMSYP